MEDTRIIDLYWQRSENAIAETALKYGGYCRTISYNILHNDEDSEECVNDTYLKVWSLLPPRRPKFLSAFIGKITRNLALDRWRYYTAEKRGGGQVTLVLDELAACIADLDTVETAVEKKELVRVLNQFLDGLKPEHRKVFMRRYWYVSTVQEIASDYGWSESKVKMMLMRTRNDLRKKLEQEGIML
ncbi:MAG: RNA polymerase sigma factor [Clostridiales bacterium]|nr:RNA polymerase sigma factor [Clostridiales bacterium]